MEVGRGRFQTGSSLERLVRSLFPLLCGCNIFLRKVGLMLRDIDYAATAVKTAITEKFGRATPLEDLQVVANERTISVHYGEHTAEGTRDNLMAAVRKAGTLENLWQLIPAEGSVPTAGNRRA